MGLTRQALLLVSLACLGACGCSRHVYRGQEIELDQTVGLLFRTQEGGYLRFDAGTAQAMLAGHDWAVPAGVSISERSVTAEPAGLSWRRSAYQTTTAPGLLLHLKGKAKIHDQCAADDLSVGLKLPQVPSLADRTQTTVLIQDASMSLPKGLIAPIKPSDKPPPPAPAGDARKTAATAEADALRRQQRATVPALQITVHGTALGLILTEIGTAVLGVAGAVLVVSLVVRFVMSLSGRTVSPAYRSAVKDITKGTISTEEGGQVSLRNAHRGITCRDAAYVTGKPAAPDFVLFPTYEDGFGFHGYLYSPKRRLTTGRQVVVLTPTKPSSPDPSERPAGRKAKAKGPTTLTPRKNRVEVEGVFTGHWYYVYCPSMDESSAET